MGDDYEDDFDLEAQRPPRHREQTKTGSNLNCILIFVILLVAVIGGIWLFLNWNNFFGKTPLARASPLAGVNPSAAGASSVQTRGGKPQSILSNTTAQIVGGTTFLTGLLLAGYHFFGKDTPNESGSGLHRGPAVIHEDLPESSWSDYLIGVRRRAGYAGYLLVGGASLWLIDWVYKKVKGGIGRFKAWCCPAPPQDFNPRVRFQHLSRKNLRSLEKSGRKDLQRTAKTLKDLGDIPLVPDQNIRVEEDEMRNPRMLGLNADGSRKEIQPVIKRRTGPTGSRLTPAEQTHVDWQNKIDNEDHFLVGFVKFICSIIYLVFDLITFGKLFGCNSFNHFACLAPSERDQAMAEAKRFDAERAESLEWCERVLKEKHPPPPRGGGLNRAELEEELEKDKKKYRSWNS